MKKILYSVQTTGMGHVTRSFEIINQLKKEGYEVDILVSGQNYQNDFGIPIKYRFEGLSFDAEKDLDLKNLFNSNHPIKFFKDVYHLNLNGYDLIITDFEPITSWKGLLTGKKVLGIGNHYKFFETRFTLKLSFFVNKLLCRIGSPVSDYIGFDYIKSPNRKILNPIVKKRLLGRVCKTGDYYITYLHNYDESEQIEFFSKYKEEKFKIYIKDAIEKEVGNVLVSPLNKDAFTNDLVNCKGVITNAGFQSTSECLYLGKKLWVVPIRNQVEQYYNSSVLKELGIICSSELNDYDFHRLNATEYRMKIYYESNTMEIVMSKIREKLN